MKKNKVILVGAINEGNVATCGETIKNQMLLEQFKQAFDKVITVDTLGWNKRPWVLLKLLLVLIFCRNAKVVFSASRSVRHIIKFLYSYNFFSLNALNNIGVDNFFDCFC